MARTVIHTETDTFDHPIDHVWSLLTSFGAIQAWMPSIKWCTINGRGIGSTRTQMSMVGVTQEVLDVLDDANYAYGYHIVDVPGLPVKGGYGRWKLSSLEENKTKVSWYAEAEEVTAEAISQTEPMYEAFMKESLAGLKRALQ